MKNLDSLTTPSEFIDYYYKELKLDLNSADLQISKVGVLGYILHILGNLQYDTKNYYNNLFNEAFPVSAIENANLIQHSSLFGFNFDLAEESQLHGTIKFDIFPFTTIAKDIVKREIKFSNIETLINDMPYKIVSNYTITMMPKFNNNGDVISKNWTLEIINSKGQRTVQPLSENNAVFDLVDARQYSEINYELTVPLYKFGSFYPIQVDLPMEQDVSDINIRVKEISNDYTEDFQIKHVKNFSTSNDPHVFYRIVENQEGKQLLLELGNGTQGKYIPKCYLTINIRTTHGERGNIGSVQIVSGVQSECTIIDYPKDPSKELSYISMPNTNIGLDISNGFGGRNILSNETLRSQLIKFIQNRENLVSEEDYNQIISKYFKHYVVLFRKISLQENIINVYIPLLDKYFNPIYALTYSFLKSQFETSNKVTNIDPLTNDLHTYIENPTLTIKGKQFISPFVFRKTIYSDSYYSLIVHPKYHKYYSDLIPLDAELAIQSVNTGYLSVITSILTPPNIYVETTIKNVAIDNDVSNIVTVFSAKSAGDLSDYSINLVIAEYSINTPMEKVNVDGDFSHYVYYFRGIIDSSFTLTLNLFQDVQYLAVKPNQDPSVKPPLTEVKTISLNTYSVKFESFQYCYDFGDTLRVREYNYDNKSYILFVPLLDLDEYSKDPSFYIDQLIAKLQSLKLNENRLITDDVQIRFLNSFFIGNIDLKKLNNTEDFSIPDDLSIVFPLKLEVHIIFDKTYITVNKIDILDQISKIKLEVSKFLNDKYTGIKMEFYKSVITDMLHSNFTSIKGINLKLTDSSTPPLNIPNSNLSLINPKYAETKLSKNEYLNYCPSLYWWDLNNINVTYAIL